MNLFVMSTSRGWECEISRVDFIKKEFCKTRFMCWKLKKTEQVNATEEQKEVKVSPKAPYMSLAPKTDLDDSKYFEALRFALQDSSIHNIAVAGKYGSGKSSIISSFLTKYGQNIKIDGNPLKSITIALAGEKKEGQNDHLVEYEILEQLFFSADESELPDSQFSRIRVHTEKHIRQYVFWLIGFVLATYIFAYGEHYFAALSWLKAWLWVKVLIGGVILTLFGFAFAKFIPRIVSLSLRKISVGYADMELDTEDKKSVLNQHIDEIIYYFNKTSTNVVVFEDLDRFGSAGIFVKLREINQILNNSHTLNRRIVFVYALRDDLFEGRERTKYFDFIIPVIPYSNSHTGSEILSRELQENSIEDDTLYDLISFYANDTRLVYNIINEYKLYSSLKREEANFVAGKMLAIVAYKNIFPKDFDLLLNNDGDLYKGLQSKDKLLQQKREEIQKRIADLDKRIKRAKEIEPISLRGLRLQYIHQLKEDIANPDFLYFGVGTTTYTVESLLKDENFPIVQQSGLTRYFFHRNGSYSQEQSALQYKFADIEKEVDPNQTYAEKENAIKDQGKLTNLVFLRAKEEKELQLLEHESIQEILSNGTEKLKSLLLPVVDEQNDSKKKSKVDYIATMLNNGYIDENYEEYLSIFQEGRWTRNDYANYMKIINGAEIDEGYEFQNREFVLRRIEDRFFKTSRVYNYSIMDELFECGLYHKREESVINTFNEDTYTYWLRYLTRNGYSKPAFEKICQSWSGLWQELSDYANTEEQNILLWRILHHAEVDQIGSILGDDIHRLERIDSLFLSDIPEKRLLAIALKNNLHFEYLSDKTPASILNYLYEHNLYVINLEMLRLVAQKAYNEEAFMNNNYTWMHESGLVKMCKYVDANIQTYIENVWLYLSVDYEKPQYLIQLLNNEQLMLDDKKRIIANYRQRDINLAQLVEQKELCVEIWKQGKMTPTWTNVFEAFSKVGEGVVRPELATYLNKEWVCATLAKAPFISKSESASADEIKVLKQELIKCKYIATEAWKRLINAIPAYNGIPQGAIDELLGETVRVGKLAISEDNYYYLKEKYEGLHLLFFNVYFKKIKEILTNDDEFAFDAIDVDLIPNYINRVSRQEKLMEYIPSDSISKAKSPEWMITLSGLSQEQLKTLLLHTGITADVRIKAFCQKPIFRDKTDIDKFVQSLGRLYYRLASQQNCALPKNDITTLFLEKLKELEYISKPSTTYKQGKERYRVYKRLG